MKGVRNLRSTQLSGPSSSSFFFFFLTMPHSMWNLSSLTRELNLYSLALETRSLSLLAREVPEGTWIHMEQVELRIHANGGTSFTHLAPQSPLACLSTFNYIRSAIISCQNNHRASTGSRGEEGEARSYDRRVDEKEVIAETIFGKESLHNCPESLIERSNPNSIIVCWCPFEACGCRVVQSINELLSCSVMSSSLLL